MQAEENIVQPERHAQEFDGLRYSRESVGSALC